MSASVCGMKQPGLHSPLLSTTLQPPPPGCEARLDPSILVTMTLSAALHSAQRDGFPLPSSRPDPEYNHVGAQHDYHDVD